jgi:transcriptional regulator GlxA family with amidase domain
MHAEGALLCSACSGVFLLAETGLFNGRETAVHWGYAEAFAKVFPHVPLSPERVLVVSGEREEFITSGASMTWHDLVLYLIARHVGATAAQTVARYFALQWHHDGLAPYIVFQGRRDHGDAAIADAQAWLATHFSIASPVEEMIRRSDLPEGTFKRRFTEATGFAPIDYVQRLRIEDAKRRLERTDEPADEISWRVGYEDAAFFRRLFKRVTGMTPAPTGGASKCRPSPNRKQVNSPFRGNLHLPAVRGTSAFTCRSGPSVYVSGVPQNDPARAGGRCGRGGAVA